MGSVGQIDKAGEYDVKVDAHLQRVAAHVSHTIP